MTYGVFCTFDLKNASRQDYENAYADLKEIGLDRVLANSNGGKTVIPTTSTFGTFTGSSKESVRDYVRDKVKSAFKARGFSSEIVVGGDWTWGADTT